MIGCTPPPPPSCPGYRAGDHPRARVPHSGHPDHPFRGLGTLHCLISLQRHKGHSSSAGHPATWLTLSNKTYQRCRFWPVLRADHPHAGRRSGVLPQARRGTLPHASVAARGLLRRPVERRQPHTWQYYITVCCDMTIPARVGSVIMWHRVLFPYCRDWSLWFQNRASPFGWIRPDVLRWGARGLPQTGLLAPEPAVISTGRACLDALPGYRLCAPWRSGWLQPSPSKERDFRQCPLGSRRSEISLSRSTNAAVHVIYPDFPLDLIGFFQGKHLI